jgi:3-phenylpropionate/trans-cinnamate dioxygenase ferredoxin reductase subunit
MTNPLDQDVLVVGASAAGLSTAEALRRGGHRGRLTLIDAEPHAPYDRPPLSKQFLSGAWDYDRIALLPPEALAGLDANFVLGERASHLDAARRQVRTSTGRILSADSVVIATGVRPRRIPGQGDFAGTHVLRSVDDAQRLRAGLRPGRRLVVVGNGVLGSEVSSTARGLGLAVSLVGSAELPMTNQLGDLGAGELAAAHRAAGVRLVGGHRTSSLVGQDGQVTGVVLDSGEVLPADEVVVAIGSEPATDWLINSGLELADGVLCDARCRAAEGIWAAGDVARWEHLGLGGTIRLENRTNATEQAIAVARDLLGDGEPYLPVPSFWTDQYGVKIQVHGTIAPGCRTDVVDGDPADGRFVALAHDGDRLAGVLGWGMPKQARLHRQELADQIAARAPALR